MKSIQKKLYFLKIQQVISFQYHSSMINYLVRLYFWLPGKLMYVTKSFFIINQFKPFMSLNLMMREKWFFCGLYHLLYIFDVSRTPWKLILDNWPFLNGAIIRTRYFLLLTLIIFVMMISCCFTKLMTLIKMIQVFARYSI